MKRKTVEGSVGIAEAVKNCEPKVIGAYPITPQTHIVEALARMAASGELDTQFINAESEHSAISITEGACAGGVRTFTASSSQGLLLMHEVLFNASGMRLPLVMVVANRAVGAPLNIWNDHQDSIAQRDCGWIQLYCENNQEAIDTVIQAFKIAESAFIPVMVCVDGFYLTHTVEPLEIPEKKEVSKFLPKFKPKMVLNPKKPISIGVYAFPQHYQDFREDLQKDMLDSKKKIVEVDKEFGKHFGRTHGGLVEEYKTRGAKYIFLSMGSVIGNAKEVVDELRKKGEKVGAVRIRSFRPFPESEIKKTLEGKKAVAVFEKSISVGGAPPIFTEINSLLPEVKRKPVLSSFVGGLGGKDVTTKDIKKIFNKIKKGKPHVGFV
jgi:pyruvate ferredoxin oxidoreductase alpha subunit